MRYLNSFLNNPIKEEQRQVPDSTRAEAAYNNNHTHEEIEVMLGMDVDEEEGEDYENYLDQLIGWDFFNSWEEKEDDQDEEAIFDDDHKAILLDLFQEEDHDDDQETGNKFLMMKKDDDQSRHGLLLDGDHLDDDDDDDERSVPLNLNLNYQKVLDAWSNRGPHLADHHGGFSLPNIPSHGYYMGEVPVMEEEIRTTRREASVLRYKEKRQNRLFSKKIRYQVRKLNADNRPRLKGRFVKRV